MRSGLKLESETLGDGRIAARGDTVTVTYDLSLNRGDVVQSRNSYTFTLGKREVIAALEYGIDGMRVGGRRRFRASPHLAYRDVGVDGIVPPNAVLVFDLTLISVARDSVAVGQALLCLTFGAARGFHDAISHGRHVSPVLQPASETTRQNVTPKSGTGCMTYGNFGNFNSPFPGGGWLNYNR
jgi:hypothetical protein